MTLLEETIKKLEDNRKSVIDVLWCGSEEFGYFTWEEFAKVANFNYDSGFGGQEIAKDLLIVGKGFWLERHEYDGSEWWEYKTMLIKPKEHSIPLTVGGSNYSWRTLKEMKEGDENGY